MGYSKYKAELYDAKKSLVTVYKTNFVFDIQCLGLRSGGITGRLRINLSSAGAPVLLASYAR